MEALEQYFIGSFLVLQDWTIISFCTAGFPLRKLNFNKKWFSNFLWKILVIPISLILMLSLKVLISYDFKLKSKMFEQIINQLIEFLNDQFKDFSNNFILFSYANINFKIKPCFY
jgi:hypothetical protein